MKNILILTLLLGSLSASTQNLSLDTGETYAVVVGISDYQDEGIPDLRFADKDALAFAGFLQSPAGGGLDEDHLKVLINEEATVAQFAVALDWLMEVVKENDKVLLYFSGHGDVERKTITQPGYLLCWDAPSRVYMAGGALALPMFQDVITTLSAQNNAKVIVVADACRSGKLSGSSIGGAQITGANLAKVTANEIKILSCQADEYSIEGEQWGGGRGAFSYHLLDGLYGMADKDNDLTVTVREIDMYLGDHVTPEVAPQNQLPMVVGNGREKLTTIFPDILEQLKEGKKGQMTLFTPTESRGMEDEILTSVDPIIQKIYAAFKRSLKEKNFLLPVDACADAYYNILIKEPSLERLHSTMRRNYAAALQDDAQQVMNYWMKTSEDLMLEAAVGEKKARLPKKIFTEKVRSFPACIERAAELLGKDHYMYATLQARKHFFEGYLLANSDRNPNKELGEKALAQFRQALEWQPELPQAYWQMIGVYGNNFLQPDSAEIYAQKAIALYPSWVRSYTKLAFLFSYRYKLFDRAKPYLEQAMQLDSNSLYVLNNWGIYHRRKKEYNEAEKYFKKAIELDSTYTNAYLSLGATYGETQVYLAAEEQFKKAIELDSTNASAYLNLGSVYLKTRRYEEAEEQYKKAIKLDSTKNDAYFNLGTVYKNTMAYSLAEEQYKKAIKLDSTFAYVYNNLGGLYQQTRRYEEAEEQFKKAIKLDSTEWIPYANLGVLYQNLRQWEATVTMTLKAIKIDSSIWVLRSTLGNAYTHLPSKMEAAKLELDKVIEMSPDYPDTYIYLAQWFLKKNQPEQAWQYIEQGLDKGIGKGLLTLIYLKEEPDFEEMRKDPKWNELLQKYFPDQQKK